MPSKERNYLKRDQAYSDLLERLSILLPEAEPILGFASSFVSNQGRNGLLAYTPTRLVFGPADYSIAQAQAPDWMILKWRQIRRASLTRPLLGAVELTVVTEDDSVKFHVGQTSGDCKNWAESMGSEITTLVERAQFAD